MPQQNITLTDEQIELAKRFGKITGKSLSSSIAFVFDLGVTPAIQYCSLIQQFTGEVADVEVSAQTPKSETRITALDLQKLADQLGIPSDRLLKAIKEIKLEVINGVHS